MTLHEHFQNLSQRINGLSTVVSPLC